MRNRKIISNSKYYVCILIYFVVSVIMNTMPGQSILGNIPYRLLYITYILLVFLNIFSSKKISIVSALLLIMGVIIFSYIYIKTSYTVPMIVILLTLGAHKCSSDIIAKIHFYSVGAIILIVTIASQMGLIVDRLFTREDGLTRHSMGMTYVTIWAGIVGFLLMEYIFLHRRNIKMRHIIFYCIVVIYSYVMTDTRIDMGINLFVLILLVLYPYIKKSKIILRLMIFSFPICAFVGYGIQAMYILNPAKYSTLDDFFTGRLSVSTRVLAQYPITLFGSYFKMQGLGSVNFDTNYGYFFIDSMYLNYLTQYGIVFMIFISAIVVYISYRLYKNNDVLMLCLLMVTALHGIIISSTILPYFNSLYIIACARINNQLEDNQVNINFLPKIRFKRQNNLNI